MPLTRKFASRLLWVSAGLAAWEWLAIIVDNSRIAPALTYLARESYPSFAVFGSAFQNDYTEATRTLLWHAGRTTQRVLLGLGIGAALGAGAGLAIYGSVVGQRSARALLGGAMNVPLFGLVPLFVYWFAGRELGIVMYVVLAVGILVASATYEAAVNIPQRYLWHAAVVGAGRLATLRSVVVPAILPELLFTFRWVLGLTWAFTLGAEYLSGRSGCGFLAYQSYLYADVGKLIVLAGVYAVLGAVSLTLFDVARGHLRLGRPATIEPRVSH